jgi:hypothetical protein
VQKLGDIKDASESECEVYKLLFFYHKETRVVLHNLLSLHLKVSSLKVKKFAFHKKLESFILMRKCMNGVASELANKQQTKSAPLIPPHTPSHIFESFFLYKLLQIARKLITLNKIVDL